MKANRSFYSTVCAFIAWATAILSGAVMAGWLTQNRILIQIRPDFPPMRFNTAFCLLLLSLMQLGLLSHDRKMARVLSISVAALCALSLSQYFTGVSVGIDQFFTAAYVSGTTVFPGRISPNTGISLALLAISGLILSFQQKPRHLLISGFFGAIAFCFGVLSLAGFFLDLHITYAWGSYNRMALHTSLAVIALGFASFLRSYELAKKSGKAETYEPLLIGGAFLCITVAFWQAFIERDAERVRLVGEAQANTMVEQLNRTLNEQYLSMIRRSHRMSWDENPSIAEWHADANLFMKHYSEIRYIEVLNSKGEPKWFYPTGKSEIFRFERNLFHPVDETEEASVTDVIRINPKEWGFVIRVGDLMTVFSADALIQNTVRVQGYEFRVTEISSGRLIYSNVKETLGLENEWASSVDLRSRLLDWRITVIPKHGTLVERASFLPLVVIIAGLLISFLFMSLVFFGMSARRREKERQMSEMFLETVLSQLPVALFSKQIKNGFRFSMWNETSEKLFGMKANEVIGKNDYDFFPKDQADHFRKDDEDTVKIGMKLIPEEVITSPTLGKMYLRTRKVVIRDEFGEPVLLLGIAEDITDQKRNQEIIEQQRLQMVNTAKMTALGEMAGGIAHEINNPLAIIEIYAGQLLSMAEKNRLDAAQMTKAATVISSTVDRIAKITRGLRSFARDAENDPFIKVQVKDILNETLEFCQEKFVKSGIQLRLSNVPDDFEIECRPVQVSQVLLNLLNNSYDAVVNTHEPWVKVEAYAEDENVMIVVTDSGQGVPASIADKIMQPFFTTKGVGKGTGLGLSISQGIIQNHQGKLYLDTASKNTRFVIAIPRQQSKTMS